jgi:uncharacterized SAM-binding protein YcdF (DUF218 family)
MEVVLHLVQLALLFLMSIMVVVKVIFMSLILIGLLLVFGILVLVVVMEYSLEEALVLVGGLLGGWFCEW